VGEIRIVPLSGLPEISPGDDLAGLLGDAVERVGGLDAGDVLVVAQKVVSKAEGRIERARTTEEHHALVLGESRRVRRRRGDLLIVETRQGFVCASAGIDRSNTPGDDLVVLLPLDPDASAARLRGVLAARFGVAPAVVVSDSFGRAWREGTTDVAIGVAGMLPLRDLRGTEDRRGRRLETTVIAVADELAAAAELVMGKADGVPAALVRGASFPAGDGRATDLVKPAELDLFP
jgi:coenzyme F420-0:L-glutamate ligase/coenzyme F420-1:gamma-L-glutamate ligase